MKTMPLEQYLQAIKECPKDLMYRGVSKNPTGWNIAEREFIHKLKKSGDLKDSPFYMSPVPSEELDKNYRFLWRLTVDQGVYNNFSVHFNHADFNKVLEEIKSKKYAEFTNEPNGYTAIHRPTLCTLELENTLRHEEFFGKQQKFVEACLHCSYDGGAKKPKHPIESLGNMIADLGNFVLNQRIGAYFFPNFQDARERILVYSPKNSPF